MSETEQINELCRWLHKTHDEHVVFLTKSNQNGCKSSCGHAEVTYKFTPEGFRAESNVRWLCHFGGYCFRGLGRWVEIEAETLFDLVVKVKHIVKAAIEKEQDEIQHRWSAHKPTDVGAVVRLSLNGKKEGD